MTEEEKKTITREKHPGCVAQGHKLVVLNKRGKEEILRSKEQSTVQSTEQSTVQSNDISVYGVGMLAVPAIAVCVFFAYNTSQDNKKQDQPPKCRQYFRKIYNK